MSEEELVIPVVAILMPLFLVPLIILLKQRQKRREWDHDERMRALELGIAPAGGSRGLFWPSMAAIAIGALVPIAAFLFTFLATVATHTSSDIWQAASYVSCFAVVCGTILAAKLKGSGDSRPVESKPVKPPHYDPDAYDTAGRRG